MIVSSMTITFDNISLEDAIKYLSGIKANACIRIDGRAVAENGGLIKEVMDEKPKAKAKGKAKASVEENEDPADREEDQVVIVDAKAYTKADLRAKAVTLSKMGKTEVLRDIFKEFGATKITDLDESVYGAVIARIDEEGVKA